MNKTMEWTDPVIMKLSENRGASGTLFCRDGTDVGDGSCSIGYGATSCGLGAAAGASGTLCRIGGTANVCGAGTGGASM